MSETVISGSSDQKLEVQQQQSAMQKVVVNKLKLQGVLNQMQETVQFKRAIKRNQIMSNDNQLFENEEYQENETNKPKNSMNLTGLILKEYETTFSVVQFVEYFVYHMLYLLFLGPLSLIILIPLTSVKMSRNLGFLGSNQSFIVQTFMYIMNVCGLGLFVYTKDVGVVTYTEIYMMVVAIIVRAANVGAKYGSSHKLRMKFLRENLLSYKELSNDFMLIKWKNQDKEIVIQQLFQSLMRNDIDLAMFYFDFMVEVDEDIKKLLNEQKQQDITSIFLKDGLVEVDEVFKRNIALLLHNQTTLNTEKLSMFGLAKQIIYKTKGNFDKLLFPKALGLSIIRAILPCITRLFMGVSVFGDTMEQNIMIGSYLFINSLLFWFNFSFILQSRDNIQFKKELMVQMSNFLGTRAGQVQYQGNKYFPSINFVDKVSLSAWGDLRKVLMDYGNKFYLRSDLNISIFAIVYIVVLILAVVQYFFNAFNFNEHALVVVTIYEIILCFYYISQMLHHGSIINAHFNIHRTQLKFIKDLVNKIKDHSENYFNDKHIDNSSNYIIRQIIKQLKSQNINNLEKYLQDISDLIYSIIEDLNYQETNSPFKFLGIKITYDTIYQLLLGASSVAVAILSSLASDLSSSSTNDTTINNNTTDT